MELKNQAAIKATHTGTLASIAAEYGDSMAKAVSNMLEATAGAAAVTQMLQKNPLTTMLGITTLGGMAAQVCELSEQLYGLTHEQGMEALRMAQELHTKLMTEAKAGFTAEG